MALRPLQDVVDREALVVRKLDHLHISALDDLPLAVRQVSQVPNGNGIVTWKIGPTVAGKEAIDLIDNKVDQKINHMRKGSNQ